MKKMLFIILPIFFIFSCSATKTIEEQFEIDNQLILDYAKDNNLTLESHESGIYYIIEKEGTGTSHPDINSNVTTHYRGTLLDGAQFDSSYDRGKPSTFSLQRVIQGWQIAIPLMVKGEKRKCFIPSKLGYGPKGTNGIPKNAVLIFDIELITF